MADCWLDTAFHEYTRNDRSAFPQEALTEFVLLVEQMERGVTPLAMDARMVNDADKLRPDLWAAADKLKAHGGLQCVADKLACAGKYRSRAEELECLLPNRRVEVSFFTTRQR